MGLFSREKKPPVKETKSPLGSLIENTMYTILRDAKTDAAKMIDEQGEANFLKHCIARLDAVTAQIETPLHDIEYHVLHKSDGTPGDVMFYFHIKGNANILQHLKSIYHLHGDLASEGQHRAYIHYREGQFRNAHHLSQLFYEDIDKVRSFLRKVQETLETYRTELRTEITKIIADVQVTSQANRDLTGDLESLGVIRKISHKN